PVHLVTQAATDLNLTFVVDEDQATRLVRELHDLLLRKQGEDAVLGPTWEELETRAAEPASRRAASDAVTAPRPAPWWRTRRDALLALAEQGTPAYVYDRASLLAAARALRGLG